MLLMTTARRSDSDTVALDEAMVPAWPPPAISHTPMALSTDAPAISTILSRRPTAMRTPRETTNT